MITQPLLNFTVYFLAGVAGYVDGRILYCGGEISQGASLTPVKTCHSLQDQGSGWLEEPFTLLQVRIYTGCGR